jgi:hypothetical protein
MIPLLDFVLFFLLVIVGIIPVSIVKLIIFLVPAILIAAGIWLITGFCQVSLVRILCFLNSPKSFVIRSP